MVRRARTPSTSSESSDWEDAHIGETGGWASDHYSSSDSEHWSCLESDSECSIRPNSDDEADAEADTAVQEKIDAMMDTGAVNPHAGEEVSDEEPPNVEDVALPQLVFPRAPTPTCVPKPVQANREPASSPASSVLPPVLTTAHAPAPAPVSTSTPSPVPKPEPTQVTAPLSPLPPIARARIATRYYTLSARLEACLAEELSALPPATPPTPPRPPFHVMTKRLDMYNKAYRTAVEADRLHRLNHGLPPRGILARMFEWVCGDGPLSRVAFEKEVPHPRMWDRIRAETEYGSVLEKRNCKEKEIRGRYERLRQKFRREYMEMLNEGVESR